MWWWWLIAMTMTILTIMVVAIPSIQSSTYRNLVTYGIREEVHLPSPLQKIQIGSLPDTWVKVSESAQETIIFYHGNYGNLSMHYGLLQDFLDDDRLNIVMMDYTGFGNTEETNERSISLEQHERDAMVVAEWSAQTFGSTRLTTMGHSLGGYFASIVAARFPNEIQQCVLINTFSDVRDVMYPLLAHLFIPEMSVAENIRRMSASRQRVFLFHCEHDTLIRPVPHFYENERALHSRDMSKIFTDPYWDHNNPPIHEIMEIVFPTSLS